MTPRDPKDLLRIGQHVIQEIKTRSIAQFPECEHDNTQQMEIAAQVVGALCFTGEVTTSGFVDKVLAAFVRLDSAVSDNVLRGALERLRRDEPS